MHLSLGKQIGIGVVLVILSLVCGWCLRSEYLNDDYQEFAPSHRPNSVPRYALWVGAADGGSYIDCHSDSALNYNDCTIYNDWTGEVEATGHYVLEGQDRAASASELKFSFFDGHQIVLNLPPVNGRIPSLIPSNR